MPGHIIALSGSRLSDHSIVESLDRHDSCVGGTIVEDRGRGQHRIECMHVDVFSSDFAQSANSRISSVITSGRGSPVVVVCF